MISVVADKDDGHGPDETRGKCHRAQFENRPISFTVVPVGRVVVVGDVSQPNRCDREIATAVVIVVVQPPADRMDTNVGAKDVPRTDRDRGIRRSRRPLVGQRDRRRTGHETHETDDETFDFGQRIAAIVRSRVQAVQLSVEYYI